ncbi:Cysteine-rich RLK (RECEPTOR-like protein kinase) 8 [Cucumis melo var. makuwa]|uniref:Cysteine-rich RLK (RECEPTOR-like protein kinase) 8 n=1 Tax=Cucumis melo var. makuwa TaxID=1194695 RepID=A0A5D3DZD7_CUCMM|nr:Cysteine-rich RLK (RECEPTOR-like protein kinase) 8 [Cucumis melo var. makuwa]
MTTGFEPIGLSGANKELRSVGFKSSIRHGQNSKSGGLLDEVLIGELGSGVSSAYSSITIQLTGPSDELLAAFTVHELLSHSKWRSAIIEEVNALGDNGTWDLVSLPTGKKTIGCKWVFATKVNPNESIARLKARFVAKGYAQTYWVNYFATFSLLASLLSGYSFLWQQLNIGFYIRLTIEMSLNHSDLQKEIYMEQQLGFIAWRENDKVCRLRKSY